jgi:hypothetical protein
MKSSSPLFWALSKEEHQRVELKVTEGERSYKGLSFEALYTSWEDFQRLFSHPRIKGKFVDLGCGLGLGCLLYGSLFPERQSIGVEFEKARYEKAQELKETSSLSNVEFLHQDLGEGKIPNGDTYFLYFPTGPVLDRILTSLYQEKSDFVLVAIESHGDLYQRLECENWLTLIDEVPLTSKRHASVAKVYQRNREERSSSLLPFTLSYQEKFLLIREGSEDWIARSHGLQWTAGNRFELKTPPRTIAWENVIQVIEPHELPHEVRAIAALWEAGEIILQGEKTYRGILRKIFLRPTFELELSTGERVKWSKEYSLTKAHP